VRISGHASRSAAPSGGAGLRSVPYHVLPRMVAIGFCKRSWPGMHSHAPVMHGTGQPAHGVSVAQGGREWAEARCAGALGALGAAEVPPAGGGSPAGCPLAAAAAALAPAAAPRSMPCRGAERAALAAFLEEAVAAGAAPGCCCAHVGSFGGTWRRTSTPHTREF